MALERLADTPNIDFAKLPPKTANLHERWEFLSAGIDHIMNGPEKSLSAAEYIGLYTTIFNYFHSYYLISQEDRSYLRGGGGLGPHLYNKIYEFFVLHLRGVLQKADGLSDMDLLQYYATEWDRYKKSAGYLNRLFKYLNGWVNSKKKAGNVFPIYRVALLQWQEYLFLPIQKDNAKLTTIVLRLITAQRDGQKIDQWIVNKTVDSFVSLGLDISNPMKECLDLYKDQIETAFIDAEEVHFKKGLETLLAENSLLEFLKKAEERLQEAENRVKLYLHTTTRRKLIRKCLDVLIGEHGEVIWDCFQHLLESDKDEDLRRMKFLLQIPAGLEALKQRFEVHVKQAGLASISRLIGEAGVDIDSLDPKAYVDTLLEVHQRKLNIVNKSFNGHVKLAASLDRSCEEFINCNAATGTSLFKSPEILVRHADALLRRNNGMTEDEVERALNRIMTLFEYIEYQDTFQAFYTTKFSKRLIHGTSASDTSEASMISKLKEACGFDYADKLQRMIIDKSLSEDLSSSFKDHMARTHDNMDMNFSIMVLGANLWPLSPPSHEFVIPVEILATYNHFQKYYQIKHSGRKLIWLWNHSNNELRTKYLNRDYILVTSSYQMAVLLQYNQNDSISLDGLVSATAISKDILVRVLAVLVKAKILINKKEQYDLNLNFKSRKICVKLNFPIKDEVKAESAHILKTVDEDRKYYIQATIIRIMKSTKTMKNQALIQAVISEIFGFGHVVPDIPTIKQEIEILLEKEYMARVDGAKDTYAYIA